MVDAEALIPALFGVMLSYLLPIVIFIVWIRFWRGRYNAWTGVCNLVYFIVAMAVLIFNHRADLGIYLALPLMFIIFAVLWIVILLSAYMTGRIEGVRFWSSITWRVIKLLGHPIIIYPTIFVISLIIDLNLIPILLSSR